MMNRRPSEVFVVVLLLGLSVANARDIPEENNSAADELSPAIPVSESESKGVPDKSPHSDRLVIHKGVSVEKHRWQEHTSSHNPCVSHQCPTGQTCRVVKNPVLQFPVPVCDWVKTPKASLPPDTTEQCADEHIGGNPFACSTEADFQAQADAKCREGESSAHVSSFKVVQPCLTFAAETQYLFANFKCCRPVSAQPQTKDAQPATDKSPAPPTTNPPSSLEQTLTLSSPSAELKTSKPTVEASRPDPSSSPPQTEEKPETEKPSTPRQKQPADKPPPKPTTKEPPVSHQKKATTNKQAPPPKQQPEKQNPPVNPAKPTKKDENLAQHDSVEKDQLDIARKPSEPDVNKAEREDKVGEDSTLQPSAWGGIAVVTTVLLVLIAALVVVTRLRSKHLFLYKPAAHTRLREEPDDVDKMDFDDTELAFFVNQAASGDGSSEEYIDEAMQEPGHLEHWDMDALTFAQTHHNEAVADNKQ